MKQLIFDCDELILLQEELNVHVRHLPEFIRIVKLKGIVDVDLLGHPGPLLLVDDGVGNASGGSS